MPRDSHHVNERHTAIKYSSKSDEYRLPCNTFGRERPRHSIRRTALERASSVRRARLSEGTVPGRAQLQQHGESILCSDAETDVGARSGRVLRLQDMPRRRSQISASFSGCRTQTLQCSRIDTISDNCPTISSALSVGFATLEWSVVLSNRNIFARDRYLDIG